MEKDNNNDVVVYVVWSSQLGAEERHVAGAAELVSDRRARHYWDGGQAVGKAYQQILRTPAPAWDVWMLFDRDVRWQGTAPPRPTWWEHQLRRMPRERFLDPERFAGKARELLSHRPAAVSRLTAWWPWRDTRVKTLELGTESDPAL